jgi:hypothetical protein
MKKPTNPGLKKLPTAVRNKMGYMADGGNPKKSDDMVIAKTPSEENKKKFKKASEKAAKATRFKNSKMLGMFPQSSLDKKQAELSRKEAVEEMNKIPKKERTMMQLPERLAYGGKVKKMAYGGKAMKMADGKMVTKKKKTAKVAKRRGDGCAVRGKTKGRMV